MTQPTCETCRFWAHLQGYEYVGVKRNNFGECRRFPPTIQGGEEGEFPITEVSIWCGEHQPKIDPNEDQKRFAEVLAQADRIAHQ